MVGHSINLGHHFLLNSSILPKKSRHMDQLVREAAETKPHPNHMKEEGGKLVFTKDRRVLSS
jgi:hypothetical protein